jgi:hypothetical protein
MKAESTTSLVATGLACLGLAVRVTHNKAVGCYFGSPRRRERRGFNAADTLNHGVSLMLSVVQ